MYLSFDSNGLIQLNPEDTLANQQPTQSASSNSTEELNGGWPAYEFGDNAFSGIVRSANGTPSLTVTSQSIANSPNQYTVEFQDEFNDYQQDSLSLVDIDDFVLNGTGGYDYADGARPSEFRSSQPSGGASVI